METVRRSKKRARYLDIESDLRIRILSGEFGENGSLPGEIPLSNAYSASRKTVRKALEQLRSQNFITTHQGMGNFVIPQAEREKMLRITGKIRLMMPENYLENDFCLEVISGIQKFTAGRGVTVSIGSHTESAASLTEYYRSFQCDALLWCSVPEEVLKKVSSLTGLRIPQVVIGERVKGAGTVYYDSLPAWRTLLQMLYNSGHRSAAFLERPASGSWSMKRRQAMAEAAEELGMRHHILCADPHDREALKKFVKDDPGVKAYIVVTPWRKPFLELMERSLIKIPQDISYAEMTASGITDDFQITRIHIPSQRMGFAAAELLITHDFQFDPEPERAIGCFTVAGLSTGIKNDREVIRSSFQNERAGLYL